ncbi:DNA internalization-related competence protein ComEC/Rec2 [Anaerocolumna xylanovorans]|uniref:Competence protein ComEC n=1 Tax=Anaerocolumna xylanovorans DSM 12503 TaxID=1121345 RepID=A0A1M7YF75_9FIRM|nr:DNA internalization-related competence protein ComEC/Rec2 [Anaerocolumna xylanovorans]SHO51263.1 competence protein ComEC [Anaerocolumna xylanovorans DSM 12503]
MEIKRPFIWILAAYLAGLAAYACSLQKAVIIGVGILLAVLLFFLMPGGKRNRLKNYFFLLLLPVLFAAGYGQINKALLAPPGDKDFKEKQKAWAKGEISLVEETDKYTRLTVKNSVLTLEKGKSYTELKILVYIDQKESYSIGNKVKISGTVMKFTKASNPGQFNEYLYYKTKKYHYKFYADSVTVVNSEINSYYQTLYRIKKQLTNTYYKLLPEKNAGILTAMMLGDTGNLDAGIKELYRENGITHILAISGLHISLLGLTLYKIFRRLHMPLLPSTLLTHLFLYSYGVLTGYGVSTNRAVVMMSVYMAAVLAGRTYDLLSGTAFSALIILLQRPLEITGAGFLLSFGAVIGIGAVYPALQKALSGKKEKLQKPESKHKTAPDVKRKLIEIIKQYNKMLLQTFLASAGVQLILLPILLWYFYEIPVYSPFINLLIIPLSSLLTILAFISVLAGCFCVPLGIFLMGSVNYILEFYEAVCLVGSGLPYKSILTGRPDILVIFTFYTTLFFFVQCNRKRGRRISLLLLFSFALLLSPVKENNLEVTFLDVGQGDGIFLKLPDNTTILVDGGSSDVKNLGKYRLEPFLKFQGINEIDYAIVTHGDSDHYSGILELMQKDYKGDIRIKNLILPGVPLEEDAYQNLIRAAGEKDTLVSVLNAGDYISRGSVYLSCLWPDKKASELPGAFSDTNSHSIVLGLHYLEFDLLLTGDLEGMGEEQITKSIKEAGQQYDILKVAHHGSKYSTGDEFLNAVSPGFAIISCGAGNSYGHPHKETINRLMECKSTILQTTESGAITVITDGNRIRIKMKK